ncbi:MAG: hypothetical protein JWO31_1638 [Phycisphaerales bacterium]|nr:hypothetical protein [Phycisphaerales bacterium]
MTSLYPRGFLFAATFCIFIAGCGKSDTSTPKAAAKTFAAAMTTGDADAAKAASTGADAKMIESMANAFGSYKKLHDAAAAKFGEEGKKLGAMGGSVDDDLVKKLADATETITGDTATVAPKDGKAMKLKKVDGAWKVDMSEMAGPMAALGSQMFDKMGKAAKVTADEIAAGQYKTIDEAQAAFTKKAMFGP